MELLGAIYYYTFHSDERYFCSSIPADTVAQYGEITSGELWVDLDARKATVHLKPSDTYHWLKMDGSYPVNKY